MTELSSSVVGGQSLEETKKKLLVKWEGKLSPDAIISDLLTFWVLMSTSSLTWSCEDLDISPAAEPAPDFLSEHIALLRCKYFHLSFTAWKLSSCFSISLSWTGRYCCRVVVMLVLVLAAAESMAVSLVVSGQGGTLRTVQPHKDLTSYTTTWGDSRVDKSRVFVLKCKHIWRVFLLSVCFSWEVKLKMFGKSWRQEKIPLPHSYTPTPVSLLSPLTSPLSELLPFLIKLHFLGASLSVA